MSPEPERNSESFKKFLIPAAINKIRCVDERSAPDQTDGVQIQGATSGLVDAYKTVMKCDEEAAWIAMQQAGIAIDGHDDDHKGPNGCGYNNKVETDPASVGAPNGVSASSRLNRVQNSRVLHYTGDHNPKFATINFVRMQTLDTNSILASLAGTFNLDAWVLDDFARLLKLNPNQEAAFKVHIIEYYKKTIQTLTNNAISTFIEIR